MTTQRTIEMNKLDYVGLFNLIKWVEDMPSSVRVGDRFWDNITDSIADLLPSIPEIDSEEFYYEMPFIKDGALMMDLISDTDIHTDENKTIHVCFVPA